MNEPELYSIEQIAELLKLHVKTVRGYVRSGRLKATRIGKQYRITRRDLNAFAGAAAIASSAPARRPRHVIASTIIDADAVPQRTAERISTMVMAGLKSGRGAGDAPRVDVIYYAQQARLRVTITASPDTAIALMKVVTSLLED